MRISIDSILQENRRIGPSTTRVLLCSFLVALCVGLLAHTLVYDFQLDEEESEEMISTHAYEQRNERSHSL